MTSAINAFTFNNQPIYNSNISMYTAVNYTSTAATNNLNYSTIVGNISTIVNNNTSSSAIRLTNSGTYKFTFYYRALRTFNQATDSNIGIYILMSTNINNTNFLTPYWVGASDEGYFLQGPQVADTTSNRRIDFTFGGRIANNNFASNNGWTGGIILQTTTENIDFQILPQPRNNEYNFLAGDWTVIVERMA